MLLVANAFEVARTTVFGQRKKGVATFSTSMATRTASSLCCRRGGRDQVDLNDDRNSAKALSRRLITPSAILAESQLLFTALSRLFVRSFRVFSPCFRER